MPVKNTESFLSACLDSICNQSFKDWELIAVDDNSSDGSFRILSEYSHLDPRIKVLKNDNNGIIPALQLAYSRSSGHYITRMDSDDLMSINKLELFTAALKNKNQNTLAIGLVKYISENTLGEGYKKYESWLNHLTSHNLNYKDIYKECSIPSPNWMVHRNSFDKCGAFNPQVYPEDYDLAFRFRRAELELISINEITHLWRDHSARASRNDPHYTDNRFTALKTKYFLEDDYNSDKELILWGAGSKGKSIANTLIKAEIPFKWVCNNQNKIGHNIYGITLGDSRKIESKANRQIIIAVSNHQENSEIKDNLQKIQSTNFFSFC